MFIFLFKQKTAYEMRISDWSSDVCSSDLLSQPYGRILYTLIPAFLFDGHPYERPIGGSIADLDRAELADVRAFHEAYYRPDNAVFVISGNFDPARLDRWVDRYLGEIGRAACRERGCQYV